MGRRPKTRRDSAGHLTTGRDLLTLPEAGGTDEQLLVVSPKVAEHATRAQKESRRAARAERKLAKAERKALAKHGIPAVDHEGATGTETSEAVDVKGAKREAKRAAKEARGAELTGVKVKRYIGVLRIVLPVVAPIVYQAAGTARSRWDDHRARRLGVAPGELSDYSGRGAGLHARIHRLAISTRDLRTRHGQESAATAFADEVEPRLSDLESAVRAAEQMPTARRRAAHAAVSAELERLEDRLLARWGVAGSAGGVVTGATGRGAIRRS